MAVNDSKRHLWLKPDADAAKVWHNSFGWGHNVIDATMVHFASAALHREIIGRPTPSIDWIFDTVAPVVRGKRDDYIK